MRPTAPLQLGLGGNDKYNWNAMFFEARDLVGLTGAVNAAIRVPFPYANGAALNDRMGYLDLIKTDKGNTILATNSRDGGALGWVGIGTMTPATTLDVAGTVTCRGGCVNGSSRALKDDVHELDGSRAMDVLAVLRPSQFVYKANPSEKKLGFIAEDVPDLVAMNDRKSLDPMEFAALLTKVVQEQQKQITAQKRVNEELLRRLERLEAVVGKHGR